MRPVAASSVRWRATERIDLFLAATRSCPGYQDIYVFTGLRAGDTIVLAGLSRRRCVF